jgi:hypothetical protein
MKSFNNADRVVVAALHRMNAPEMQPLLKFFDNLLSETKDALIAAQPDVVPKLQGRAGVLKEFLDAVDKAASTLERMQQHP